VGIVHKLTISGTSAGWSVSHLSSIVMEPGESTDLPVTLGIPTDAVSGTTAVVVLTATSGINDAAYDVVTNTTVVNWHPGVRLTPVYSEHVNPGTVITYIHKLTNTGNSTDTFGLIWGSSLGWATVTPTLFSDMGPNQVATLLVVVDVPATAPGGLTETTVITAVGSSGVRAAVRDRTMVNHTAGDRYVAWTHGSDPLNNCLVYGQPCRTIAHAVSQASGGDIVKVAGGVYNEYDINLNKNITLRGGYSTYFKTWDPDVNPTTIDAQGQERLLRILGSPTVEWFTLRGGWRLGSGAGVYIEQGSPVIHHNRIMDNEATEYGGGDANPDDNRRNQCQTHTPWGPPRFPSVGEC
jgi:hypothetical protein